LPDIEWCWKDLKYDLDTAFIFQKLLSIFLAFFCKQIQIKIDMYIFMVIF
jgi:hypothetical protein